MFVEPPGQDLPAGPGLTISRPVRLDLRTAAAGAAVVLAVLSRGDATVLALALVVVAWRPVALAAVVPALAAIAWRWGSSSLEAIAGAQAVLGPSGWTGSGRSVAGAWLAAVAIVLATPSLRPEVGGTGVRVAGSGAPNVGGVAGTSEVGGTGVRVVGSGAPNLVVASAFGAAAGLVVAGPAVGGDVWVRVVAVLVAAGLALAVGRARRRVGGALDAAAAVAGVAALSLVAGESPSASGVLDTSALIDGVAIAGAVAAAIFVAMGAVRARSRTGRDQTIAATAT